MLLTCPIIVKFFSYCFKYMMPTILKNFDKFYKIYFEVLKHKNKFVKKFAAESFSYVLRKAKKESLAKMVNSVCLKPMKKPYKYLTLSKSKVSGDVEMTPEVLQEQSGETQGLTEHEGILYARYNELADPAFCQFEKWINSSIEDHKFVRQVEDKTYEYHFETEERLNLIATLSTIFTEAIYGVQKKLYTEWTSFVDVLIENIKSKNSEFSAWHVNILRFTFINLISKLNVEAIHELSGYIIKKMGEECLNTPNKAQNTLKLEVCMLLIRDLFVYKEGNRLSPINTITNVGFLYKLLKLQTKSKVFDSNICYLLVECLYLGYHNKPEQFIKAFNMNHSTKLTDLIQKLGIKFTLHFYCLGSMKNLNQKFYDFTKYYIMLMNRQAKVLPVLYIKSETERMRLIFKPLTQILFSVSEEHQEYLIHFLTIFITIKNKAQSTEVINVPEKFANKLIDEIKRIEACVRDEKQELTGQLLNQLWLFTKVGCSLD